MNEGYIALLGLGAIGTPLANLLYKKIENRFIIISDEKHASRLKNRTIYINDSLFKPNIITSSSQIKHPVKLVFVCVKNYSLNQTVECLKNIVDKNTVILPLQNGVYSYEYISNQFPDNIVLQGFAQGPNTIKTKNGFVYQNPGVYHIGTDREEKIYKQSARYVCELLTSSGIKCYLDDDIQHQVWKKLMLNVAGNAITALTEIDYSAFKYSQEIQIICRKVMFEYKSVAKLYNINIYDSDIEDVMNYFLQYNESKHTSMLEDVLNKRMTENEYIAGHIMRLAKRKNVSVPYIEMLYYLIKIKEDVYMGQLKSGG